MTTTRQPVHTRLPSLTGLRVILALLVFANQGAHLVLFKDAGIQDAYRFVASDVGVLAISIFFMLSGFVLTWSSGPTVRPGRFWRGRLVKIFPNHIVVFVVGLIILLAAGEPIRIAEAVANLFLVHAWIPDPASTLLVVNGPTWSLSAEVFFYAAFPFLILLVRRVREERLWFWVAGLIGLVLLLPIFSKLLPDTQNPFSSESWLQMWFLYFFPLTRCLDFLVGMFLARIVRTGRWIGLGVAPATLALIAAYVGSLFAPAAYRDAAIYVVPVTLLIGTIGNSDANGKGTLLSRRAFVMLGEITFAFFIVRITAVHMVRAVVDGSFAGYDLSPTEAWSTENALLFLLAVFVLSLLLAVVLHRVVQSPAIRRWGRRNDRAVSGPVPKGRVEPGRDAEAAEQEVKRS